MRMWLLGGLVWAGAIGAVLYFTPRKACCPLKSDCPIGALFAPAAVAAEPPATPVVDVLDLDPLLDPPAPAEDDAAEAFEPAAVPAGPVAAAPPVAIPTAMDVEVEVAPQPRMVVQGRW